MKLTPEQINAMIQQATKRRMGDMAPAEALLRANVGDAFELASFARAIARTETQSLISTQAQTSTTLCAITACEQHRFGGHGHCTGAATNGRCWHGPTILRHRERHPIGRHHLQRSHAEGESRCGCLPVQHS